LQYGSRQARPPQRHSAMVCPCEKNAQLRCARGGAGGKNGTNFILDHRIERNRAECTELNQETDIESKHARGCESTTRAARSSQKYCNFNFPFLLHNIFQI
jgi:hypothetical protein